MTRWNSDGTLHSAEIHVYTKTKNGNSCPTGRSDIKHILKHEYGHVLGLLDCTNTSYLMGNVFRAVTTSECAAVDPVFRTTSEPAPGFDPNCDPGREDCNETPLVLDLDGRGIVTSGLDDPVTFDIDADGQTDVVGWTGRRGKQAFLVVDLNSNGVVDDGSELFGGGTTLPNGQKASDGFAALAAHDSASFGGNGDGVIGPEDVVWYMLLLWEDHNHDGRTTPGELRSLDYHGIVALELAHSDGSGYDSVGNLRLFAGTYIKRERISGSLIDVRYTMEDIAFQVAR